MHSVRLGSWNEDWMQWVDGHWLKEAKKRSVRHEWRMWAYIHIKRTRQQQQKNTGRINGASVISILQPVSGWWRFRIAECADRIARRECQWFWLLLFFSSATEYSHAIITKLGKEPLLKTQQRTLRQNQNIGNPEKLHCKSTHRRIVMQYYSEEMHQGSLVFIPQLYVLFIIHIYATLSTLVRRTMCLCELLKIKLSFLADYVLCQNSELLLNFLPLPTSSSLRQQLWAACV